MPEIEIPAHSWALLQVMPGLRDEADQSGEVSVQGYAGNVMNPGKRETWAFLEEVVGSVADTFRAPVIHLGCDEVPAGAWTKSPAAAAWMKEHGLNDTVDLLEKMMQRTAGMVAARGRRPAAWEEAAPRPRRRPRPRRAAVCVERPGPRPRGGPRRLRGGDVPGAATPTWTWRRTPTPRERGLNWAALVNLADTLAWEPASRPPSPSSPRKSPASKARCGARP